MADIFVEPCHVKLLLSLGFSKTLLSFPFLLSFILLSSVVGHVLLAQTS